ncbi:KSR2 Kinase, partial [Corvus moneduloides]|nr:KSR2 Kinase [Corvus moneduloides]
SVPYPGGSLSKQDWTIQWPSTEPGKENSPGCPPETGPWGRTHPSPKIQPKCGQHHCHASSSHGPMYTHVDRLTVEGHPGLCPPLESGHRSLPPSPRQRHAAHTPPRTPNIVTTMTPPGTPPVRRRNKLKPPGTPPPSSRKLIHLIPGFTALHRSKSHEFQLGHRVDEAHTPKGAEPKPSSASQLWLLLPRCCLATSMNSVALKERPLGSSWRGQIGARPARAEPRGRADLQLLARTGHFCAAPRSGLGWEEAPPAQGSWILAKFPMNSPYPVLLQPRSRRGCFPAGETCWFKACWGLISFPLAPLAPRWFSGGISVPNPPHLPRAELPFPELPLSSSLPSSRGGSGGAGAAPQCQAPAARPIWAGTVTLHPKSFQSGAALGSSEPAVLVPFSPCFIVPDALCPPQNEEGAEEVQESEDDFEEMNLSLLSARNFPRKASQTSIFLQEWDIPFEQLEIGELIGKGRFGQVFHGRWHGEVAIRLIDIERDNEDQLKAFKREVMAYRQTRHENVVLFMGACMSPPHLAIITSLCKGRTLYSVVRDAKIVLDVNKTRQIAQEIVKGMGYLHAKGILHKDLKSKNVFYDNGKVVITDFGLFSISGVLQAGRRENKLRIQNGWLCHLAPEIIRQLSPDTEEDKLPFSKHSDVFALGTIWYELHAREWPFKTQPAEAIIWQVGRGMKPNLSQIGMGKEISDILLFCWAYEQEERPTFTKLMDMLEKLPKRNRRLSHPGHFWKSAE